MNSVRELFLYEVALDLYEFGFKSCILNAKWFDSVGFACETT